MTDDERTHTPEPDEEPAASGESSTGTAAGAPAGAVPDTGTDGTESGATRDQTHEPASQTEFAGAPHDTSDAMDTSDASGASDAVAAGNTAHEPVHERATGVEETPAPTEALAREVAALKEQVAQLVRDLEGERDHATDYMQKWQRAQADMANFRRRVQQEEEQFANMAAAQAMALVLPALDSFERAFKTLPESLQRLTWIEGIFLVESQLRRTLEAHGVAPFEPKPGDALDPSRHQPVAQTESAAHPEGAVVEVVQRGYELNGRVLRPALVRIARAPATPLPSPPSGEREGDGATSGSGPPPGSPSPAEEGGAGP